MIAGAVSGTLVLYAIGLPIMKFVLNLSWPQAFAVGLIPFLPGDLVKLVAVILLGNMFANRVRTFLAEEQLEEAATDE
jgi:biotin transport system substrate-specific component